MTSIRWARRSVASVVRRVSVLRAVKARLHGSLPWRPGVREIPVHRLLLGLQNRLPADEFAVRYGDLLWPSTPVGDGPHAQLLRLADAQEQLSPEAILASSYAELGRVCIGIRGFFFTASDDQGIVEVAHNYIGRHRGDRVAALGEHQSPAGSPVRVAHIRSSECFQVLDGHHRVASAIVRGQASLPARVKWVPVTTPLQRMLKQMAEPGGRILRQPVTSPEIGADWEPAATFAAAPHQVGAMLHFLTSRGLVPPATCTYLDVASAYGWTIAQMSDHGFAAEGVEKNPTARPLGAALYGLSPRQVHVAVPLGFLASTDRRWDVVSCLDMDAVAVGVGLKDAEAVARLLEERTLRVLFLQRRGPQPGRDGDVLGRVEQLLRESSSFEEVVDVGVAGQAEDGSSGGAGLLALVRT